MSSIRSHVSYANVASTLAIVLAASGAGYAATALPKNSVGAPQIKTSAVRSADVKDGALLAKDFKAGQLKAGPAGPAGAIGPIGPVGPAGTPGTPGTFTSVTTQGATSPVEIPDGGAVSLSVGCLAGQVATGGGGRIDATEVDGAVIVSSRPATSISVTTAPANGAQFTAWRISAFNPVGGVTTGLVPQAWVVCVSAP